MSDRPKESSALGELTTAMTGASFDGGHGAAIGLPGEAVVKAGHEADSFQVKSILLVPVAIAMMAGLAYIVVTAVFGWVNRNSGENAPVAGPAMKAADDRFAHISSTDNSAKVSQPRLEAIRMSDSTRNGKTDPEYFRSVRFSDSGNSPEYHPEDLRPENYIDPETKQKVLRDYAWVIDQKVARIPVSVAMGLLISEKLLPVQAKESKPVIGTATIPKLSNGGWGLSPEKKTEPAKPAPPLDDKKGVHK